MNQFCCEKMMYEISMNQLMPTPFIYDSVFREYAITIPQSSSVFCITYCPMCGTKFPVDLRNKWFDVLEQEYGLDDPSSSEQRDKIPAEFLTDEWWKK